MGAQNIKIGILGNEGIFPELVFISTTDPFNDVLEPGYLNSAQSQGFYFNNQQLAFVSAQDSSALLKVQVENGVVTLVHETGEVYSVFDRTGAVIAQTGDYTAAQVTNSFDLSNLDSQTALGSLLINKTLSVGTDLTQDVFSVTGYSRMYNALTITTPIPDDPLNQSPQLFLNKTNQGIGEVSGFASGYKDTFDAGYILAADFSGSPLPTPKPIYINQYGGNVSVGELDIESPLAEAPLHVFSNPKYGLIVSGASTNKTKRLVLGYNLDTNQSEIQSYIDSVSFDTSPILINPEGGAVSIGYPPGHSFNSLLDVNGDMSVNGNVQGTRGIFGVPSNTYSGNQLSNLFVMNESDASQQLNIAYDGINDIGFIQSSNEPTPTPLILQSGGGNIGLAVPNNHVFSRGFEVGSSSRFLDTAFFENGINVADAGGGIQFNDTGAMDVNTGVSFFSSNQFYRIGFDDNGGTSGWIRSNVDTADSDHGFIWSSGFITSPLNALMYLRGDGKLALGQYAETLNFQSLCNVYGDIFLSNMSSPSTPTSGAKIFSKSDKYVYAKNSDGTEYNLCVSDPVFNIVSVSSSTYTTDGTENELEVYANGTAITITVDTSLLKKELAIYKVNAVIGSLNISIVPNTGQTINGSSSAITISSTDGRYSYVKISPSSSATEAYISGMSIL